MNTMKKLLLCLLIVSAFATLKTSAQSYTNAIGARLGFTQGITFRHFLHEEAAIEGILSTRWNGFLLTGLYEVHKPLDGALNWFYGGGAHIGYWGNNLPAERYINEPKQSYMVIGVDLIIGLDFTFPDIPINLSLDWKPAFNVIGDRLGDSSLWIDGGALSIRYAFD